MTTTMTTLLHGETNVITALLDVIRDHLPVIAFFVILGVLVVVSLTNRRDRDAVDPAAAKAMRVALIEEAGQ